MTVQQLKVLLNDLPIEFNNTPVHMQIYDSYTDKYHVAIATWMSHNKGDTFLQVVCLKNDCKNMPKVMEV